MFVGAVRCKLQGPGPSSLSPTHTLLCLRLSHASSARWPVNPSPTYLSLPAPCFVSGYSNAVLTPNKVEFERLANKLGVAVDSPDALQRICRRRAGWALGEVAPGAGCDNREFKQAAGNPMGNPGPACEIEQPWTQLFCQSQVCRPARPCSLGGPVVVRKGREDAVGDGHHVVVCDEEGSPRRAGGQVRSGPRWFEGLRI